MGFGNHVPYRHSEPVKWTFGRLRNENLGCVIQCRRCDHWAHFTPKALRFLRDRLRDELELTSAVGMFRCSACHYDLVKLAPEERVHREIPQ